MSVARRLALFFLVLAALVCGAGGASADEKAEKPRDVSFVLESPVDAGAGAARG